MFIQYVLVMYHDLEFLKFAFCITLKEEISENTKIIIFLILCWELYAE